MSAKYQVVVAGCGGMANKWVDYALGRKDTEIVGLVDIKQEFAQAMAERKGLSCPTFTSLQTALVQTGANLVFDITIPSSHYSIASTALEQGCHVFGEKPLAESMGECLSIVKLAERTGRTHAVMQNRRYDGRIRALRKLITEGLSANRLYRCGFFYRRALWRIPRCNGAVRCCLIWRSIRSTRHGIYRERSGFGLLPRI